MEHSEEVAGHIVSEILGDTGKEVEIVESDGIPDSTEPVVLDDFTICKKLVQLHQSAISRGLEFDLTFKTVKKLLMRKKCFYTGKVMEESGPMARSIDRVDSSRGYVEGNVVACTVDINSKKGHLTVDEILLLAKNLEKHKNGNS